MVSVFIGTKCSADYVVPQKYYFMNEYETQVMGFYGPNTAPYMCELLQRLGNRLPF